METVTSRGHGLISITSVRTTEFIDITDRIKALVDSSGISLGIVNVQALHTTTAIVINEHEPLLLTDFETTLNNTAPIDAVYSHDDPDRRCVNLTPNVLPRVVDRFVLVQLGQLALAVLAGGVGVELRALLDGRDNVPMQAPLAHVLNDHGRR